MSRDFTMVRLPMGMIEQIDSMRGSVPRERWVRETLGEVLEGRLVKPVVGRSPVAKEQADVTMRGMLEKVRAPEGVNPNPAGDPKVDRPLESQGSEQAAGAQSSGPERSSPPAETPLPKIAKRR